MKTPWEILSEIAETELSIPTLKTRKSDSLDFHEVSVWGLQEALKKAFEAGREREKLKGKEQ